MTKTENVSQVLSVVSLTGSYMLSYLGLPFESCVILLVLMILDFITGMQKASCLHIPITADKIKDGIRKKFNYWIILCTIVLVFKGLNIQENIGLVITYFIYMYIFAEAYSILGNIISCQTKEDKKEVDILTFVANNLREIMKYGIEQIIKAIRAMLTKSLDIVGKGKDTKDEPKDKEDTKDEKESNIIDVSKVNRDKDKKAK